MNFKINLKYKFLQFVTGSNIILIKIYMKLTRKEMF